MWHQRGPVAESSQIRLPPRDGEILIERCSMNVCHILWKDEVCTMLFFHDFTQSKPSICMSTQRFILEEAGPLVKTIAMRTR